MQAERSNGVGALSEACGARFNPSRPRGGVDVTHFVDSIDASIGLSSVANEWIENIQAVYPHLAQFLYVLSLFVYLVEKPTCGLWRRYLS